MMTNESPTPISLRERVFVLVPAAVASLIAILWSWRHHAFELFGDSEAHIHIARRLFDSRRPGITELGSVWLPFPHVVMVPFLLVDSWWRSGFAAVIPSAASYLLGVWGLYRLARKWLTPAGAGVVMALYAANPNLLYLQTTAMNEPVFLCELIWAVLLLVEWFERVEDDEPATLYLWAAIFVDLCAVFTRYDGWILAAISWAVMAWVMRRKGRLFEGQFIAASVVLLAGPVTWMTYNAAAFGDWLEFMRGPYSAKAIEIRTSASMDNPHPGFHNPWVAFQYFLKAAEMDVARLGWGETVALAAVGGTMWGFVRFRRPLFSFDEGPKAGLVLTLLLWLPLPFYAYSVSYGYVPIFIPVWTPFGWYNTRYGMELLAALAFFFGFAVEGLSEWLGRKREWLRPLVIAVVVVLAAVNVVLMLRELPLTYVEGLKNSASRAPYTRQLGAVLGKLHAIDPKAVALMDTSTFPNVVSIAGMTYKDTINESDKEFYWAALGDPAGHAQIVMVLKGGEIDKAVQAHPEHLREVASFHPTGKTWDQIPVTLYVTDTFPLPPGGLQSLQDAGR